MATQLMTMSKAAKRLGISRQWMHQLIEEHGIEVQVFGPRTHLVKTEDVEKLLAMRAAERMAGKSRKLPGE